VIRQTIMDMKGPGVILGIHNLDESIRSFAHACFIYALRRRWTAGSPPRIPVSKIYDHRFKDIFARSRGGLQRQVRAAGIAIATI
jgi:isocitrate dehydrogenase